MADKSVASRVHALQQKIASAEAERADWAESLAGLENLIRTGDHVEVALEEKAACDTELARLDAELSRLHAELAAIEETLPKKPEPAAPKFDPEKHPLLKKATDKVEADKPAVFHAGDLCEAQWTDRQWYKAKVQTVLGSASAPKYHVRFIDYKDTTTTVDRDTIRAMPNDRKRKADTAPATASVTPTTNSPHVISGPASVNPNAVTAKQGAGIDTSVPTNRRPIGSKKALERKANSWQDFQKKGPGKKLVKKESQFRTGEGVNSRVGFTGSGAGMTKAPKRIRYTKGGEEDDGEDAGTAKSRGDYSSSHRH